MKMLIISNLYPNLLEKNKATFNRRQFCELSQSNDIKVIAPVSWTNRLFLKWSTRQSIPYKEIIDGIDVYHPTYFFTPKIFSFLSGFFCFFSILVSAIKLIRTMRPNCILATWAYPDGFAAILIGRLFRIPVFIKVHGSDIHSIDSIFVRKLTVWGLKKAQKVFSVSADLNRIMEKMDIDSNKIITVYNGVDDKKFYPQDKILARKKFNIPLNKTVLLYVGNLEIVKGPDVLIDAFKELSLTSKNYVLYITGKGSQLKTIQKRCHIYGLGESVIFSGPVAHDDMPQWMNIADLLIVPSRNEGIPNVILEAMACQIPVVATNVGGIPEVVVEKQTGFLVEQGCPERLSGSIQQAINKEWDKELIDKQSKRYTWKNNASIITNAIKNNMYDK